MIFGMTAALAFLLLVQWLLYRYVVHQRAREARQEGLRWARLVLGIQGAVALLAAVGVGWLATVLDERTWELWLVMGLLLPGAVALFVVACRGGDERVLHWLQRVIPTPRGVIEARMKQLDFDSDLPTEIKPFFEWPDISREAIWVLVITMAGLLFLLFPIQAGWLSGFAVFYLIGASLMVYGAWRLRRIEQSMIWPRVSGRVQRVVIKAVAVREQYHQRVEFYPEVEYRFTLAGNEYDSRRMSLVPGEHRHSEWQPVRDALTHFVPGEAVTVYYDPDRPGYAVLVPGARKKTRQHYRTLVVAGCLVILAGAVLAGVLS